ncbi:MAG TPA: conjugal transfer protein TraH [Acinetobacter sp.]|nr:conjugal transfer protein TraH [Acinetobacter sp.]
MKCYYKKLVFLILSLVTTVSSNPIQASVKEDLEQFFISRGQSVNVTEGGAYRDQMGSYFTGGSLMTRAKAANTNLMSIQMPSFNSGCGGIDLFMGGFSFINTEAFMQMARNIGSNALSYGFSLALQTVTPQIKSILDRLMAVAQDANNMNINSCQMSAALVGGLWPRTDASSQLLCNAMGTSKNIFTDYAAARQGCGAGGQRGAVNSQKSPEFKDILGDEFNLAWKALKKHALFAEDNELAELFMSLSGTFIAKKGAGNIIQPHYLPPLIDNENLLSALVNGGEVHLYHCDNHHEDACLNPVKTVVNIPAQQAFLAKVDTLIQSLNDKLKTDSPSTPAEKDFVNSTHLPIFKILTIQTAFKPDNSPLKLSELSEVIAYDILLKYLNRVVDLVSESVKHLQSVQINDADIQSFLTELRTSKTLIYQRRQGLFQQMNTTLAVMERTQQIERQLHQLFAEGEN